MRRDRETGVFADPERIRRIGHEGTHFHVDGPHLSEPSPQRTPVLFQAGSSPRGRAFAAKHAECVFIAGNSKAEIRTLVQEIRRNAEDAGRGPAGIPVFLSAVSVPGRTKTEAEHKMADYSPLEQAQR